MNRSRHSWAAPNSVALRRMRLVPLSTKARLTSGRIFDFAMLPLLTGLATIVSPAFGQTKAPVAALPTATPDTSNNPSESKEILVTGSRLKRSNLDTPAPITVVNAEDFQLRGAVNIENVINALPQAVSGTTSFSNNPGGGVATLDLRGLGSQRTLVLVNGRRYMFYDVNQQVDLNTIPQFLIKNVEVVTGGASAVYGSDAIAGVVNFSLRDVDGLEIGGETQIAQRGYGAREDVHFAVGMHTDDDRGHFTLYGEYYNRDAVLQGDRDIFQHALGDNPTKTGFTNGGSASVPQGRFSTTSAYGAGTNYTGLGAIFATPGVSRPYTTTDAYNYAPSNYLMVPEKRWLGGAYGEYEISPAAKVYTELSFVNNRIDSSLAATPFSGTYTINIANNAQYLSAADVSALRLIAQRQGTAAQDTVNLTLARRVTEAGVRSEHDDRTAYRILAGIKGDLSDRWSYDAYYSYARTRNSQLQTGDISKSKFSAALLSGSINIFGPDTITPASVKTITIDAQNQDISVLEVANASVTGRLFNLGLGGDDISLAFGTEYRSTNSRYIPDSAVASGDAIGLSVGQPTKGGYNVKEGFAELRVPIMADRPFVHRLELNAAGRYSSYSLGAVGGTWTYATGVEYSPIRILTLRGQYSRAVRAPSVAELYGGIASSSPTVADPCALSTALTNGAIKAVCIATGVPAAEVGTAALQPNTQIKGLTGGNANLKEETSNSYTFGGVIRPLKRLSLTADYYHIKVDNVIAPAAGGAANILNLCYNVIQNASSAVCQLIKRNPTTGVIDGSTSGTTTYAILATSANLGQLVTSGVDFSLDYVQPLNFGLLSPSSQISLNANANYTDRFDTTPVTGLNSVIKCAGRFGATCGEPQPHFKSNVRLTYRDGPVTTSLGWRHLGSVRDDNDSTTFTVERIGAYDVFDLAISAKIKRMTLTAGVNNLFDRGPPLLGSNQEEANTYPSTYDVLGRDFFVSASVHF